MHGVSNNGADAGWYPSLMWTRQSVSQVCTSHSIVTKYGLLARHPLIAISRSPMCSLARSTLTSSPAVMASRTRSLQLLNNKLNNTYKTAQRPYRISSVWKMYLRRGLKRGPEGS